MAPWSSFAWRVARGWLPVAAGLTVLAATLYVCLQQSERLSANDAPERVALEAAAALASGATPEQVSAGAKVDLSRSLAPAVLVFDRQAHLIASSASVDGNPPDYPSGVLQAVSGRGGENRVTWQPEPGLRLATVALPWSGGFVVGAASLKPAERRTDLLLLLTGAGWAASLGASLLAAALAAKLSPPRVG